MSWKEGLKEKYGTKFYAYKQENRAWRPQNSWVHCLTGRFRGPWFCEWPVAEPVLFGIPGARCSYTTTPWLQKIPWTHTKSSKKHTALLLELEELDWTFSMCNCKEIRGLHEPTHWKVKDKEDIARVYTNQAFKAENRMENRFGGTAGRHLGAPSP
ncbi:uncharacterized protein AAEQ78_004786 [Lycaon pictus]